jgi:hypothetical protein
MAFMGRSLEEDQVMSDVFQQALAEIRTRIGDMAFLALAPKARTAMIYAEMAKIDRKQSEARRRVERATDRIGASDSLSPEEARDRR